MEKAFVYQSENFEDEILFPELRQDFSVSSNSEGISSSPSTNSSVTPDMKETETLLLFHKPRGSKGVWHQVKFRDKIRVTKGKGKRIRLQCSISQSIDLKHLSILLVDLDKNCFFRPFDHFSIENSKLEHDILEVDLKLYTACKRLKFSIQTTYPQRKILGQSVEFGTHNSGGILKETKVKSEQTTDQSDKENFDLVFPLQTSSFEIKNEMDQLPNLISQPLQTNANNSIPDYDEYGHQVFQNSQKKRKHRESSQLSLFNETEVNDDQFERTTILEGSLDVRGTVRARAFSQMSDLRLKTDIKDIVDAIKIVSSLQGKTYRWKNGEENGNRVIGLIAQEVQRVLPEVVKEDENGFLSVSYSEILPILIEAFKELLDQQKHDKQEVQLQIQELKQQLDSIMTELDKRDMAQADPSNLDQLLQKIAFASQNLSLSEANGIHIRKSRLFIFMFSILFLVSSVFVIIGSLLTSNNFSFSTCFPSSDCLKAENQTSSISIQTPNPGNPTGTHTGNRTGNIPTTNEITTSPLGEMNPYYVLGISLICFGILGILISFVGIYWSIRKISKKPFKQEIEL